MPRLTPEVRKQHDCIGFYYCWMCGKRIRGSGPSEALEVRGKGIWKEEADAQPNT